MKSFVIGRAALTGQKWEVKDGMKWQHNFLDSFSISLSDSTSQTVFHGTHTHCALQPAGSELIQDAVLHPTDAGGRGLGCFR